MKLKKVNKSLMQHKKKVKKRKISLKIEDLPRIGQEYFFRKLKKYFAGFMSNICDFLRKRVISKHIKVAEQ